MPRGPILPLPSFLLRDIHRGCRGHFPRLFLDQRDLSCEIGREHGGVSAPAFGHATGHWAQDHQRRSWSILTRRIFTPKREEWLQVAMITIFERNDLDFDLLSKSTAF